MVGKSPKPTQNTSIRNTASRKLGTADADGGQQHDKVVDPSAFGQRRGIPRPMPTTMEKTKAVRPSRMVTGAVVPDDVHNGLALADQGLAQVSVDRPFM